MEKHKERFMKKSVVEAKCLIVPQVLHSGAALYFARRPFSTSFLSGRGTPK
jgi:hypothetical protein